MLNYSLLNDEQMTAMSEACYYDRLADSYFENGKDMPKALYKNYEEHCKIWTEAVDILFADEERREKEEEEHPTILNLTMSEDEHYFYKYEI